MIPFYLLFKSNIVSLHVKIDTVSDWIDYTQGANKKNKFFQTNELTIWDPELHSQSDKGYSVTLSHDHIVTEKTSEHRPHSLKKGTWFRLALWGIKFQSKKVIVFTQPASISLLKILASICSSWSLGFLLISPIS